MRKIIIVAGPNGAGKTSFATQYLSSASEELVFVNADEIAREMSFPAPPGSMLELRAGREMLKRIDALIASNTAFMFETTLASLAYARKIPAWRKRGFRVALIYLRLPSAEAAIDRVRKRVAAGGHDIPEAVIRQRFGRSDDYLNRLYKPIVDEWYVWDSLEGDFKLREAWDD